MELIPIILLSINRVYKLNLKDDLGVGIGLHVDHDEKNRDTQEEDVKWYYFPSISSEDHLYKIDLQIGDKGRSRLRLNHCS